MKRPEVLLALDQLKFDERNQLYLSSSFLDLSTTIHASYQVAKNEKLKSLRSSFMFISQDLWNLASLMHRLEWMLTLRSQRQLDDGLWITYASLDIDHFFVEIKSAMNYLADIVRLNYKYPDTIPPRSLRKLYKWACNGKRLDQGYMDLLESFSWFPEYGKVRDANMHLGSFTITFPTDGIVFQNYMKSENQIFDPEIMWNENVVNFRSFAAIAFGRLLKALEDTANLLIAEHKLFDHLMVGAKSYHSGHETFKKWAELYLNGQDGSES